MDGDELVVAVCGGVAGGGLLLAAGGEEEICNQGKLLPKSRESSEGSGGVLPPARGCEPDSRSRNRGGGPICVHKLPHQLVPLV